MNGSKYRRPVFTFVKKINCTMKIALLSPRKNAPSETFIQAHCDFLNGDILFYHSGAIPKFLEERPLTVAYPKLYRIAGFLKRQIGIAQPSPIEKAFERSLRQQKPDIILAEYGVCGAQCVPIAKRAGIPLSVHFHGYDASELRVLEDYKERYERMFEYASSIIVVSEVMRQKLISLGAPAKKIFLTHYGANPSFIKFKPSLVSKKVLAVGRMVDKKAPHLLVLAFRRCLERHPDAKLVYIGAGPLFQITKDLVKQFKLDNNVELRGLAGREEIQNEMLTARCFAQHSRTAENGDMEGTPVAVIEAQSAGLPVVSTHHAGIPDIVLHEQTGFLVEEGDAERMGDYISSLLDDAELARQMGAAGKSRIKENFTMEHHIATINQALAFALSKTS